MTDTMEKLASNTMLIFRHGGIRIWARSWTIMAAIRHVYLPESAGGGGGCAYSVPWRHGHGALGHHCQAEVISHTLRSDDQFVVIASDGVWEFMTNQRSSTRSPPPDPLDACRDVVGQAYRLWLQFDLA